IDQVGDPPARHQDLALELAQQHRTLVVQRLEHTELAGSQAVPLRVTGDQLAERRLRSREDHQELERLLFPGSGLKAVSYYLGSKHLITKIVFNHPRVNPCPAAPHRKLPTTSPAEPGAAGKKHGGSINSASMSRNSPPTTIPSILAYRQECGIASRTRSAARIVHDSGVAARQLPPYCS